MKMKKAAAFVLAAVIIAASCLSGFAYNESTVNGEEAVAEFSVCSSMSIPVVAGHTYIYVKNLTDKPLRVGLYDVPVGEGVSIGSLSISVSDGWGLYYNLEAHRENRDDHLSDIWSKTVTLNQSELDKLNEKLNEYLNHWDLFFNCAYFAYSMWNGVTGDFIMPFVIPLFSHWALQLSGGEKGKLELFVPTEEQIFRQVGSGKNAKLVRASSETINS